MIKHIGLFLICFLFGVALGIGNTEVLTREESIKIWKETEYYPLDKNQIDGYRFLNHDSRVIVNPPLDLLKSFSDEEIVSLMVDFPLMKDSVEDYESNPESISCMFFMYERDVDIFREMLRRGDTVYLFLKAYRETNISANDFEMIDPSDLRFTHKVALEAFMCQFVNYYYDYFDEEEKTLSDTIVEEKTPLYLEIQNKEIKNYFSFERIEYSSSFYDDFQYDEEFEYPFRTEEECINIWYETEDYPVKANPPDWDTYSLDEYFQRLNPPADLLKRFSDEKLATLTMNYPMLWQLTGYDMEQLDCLFDMYERKVDVYKELLRKENGIQALLDQYRDSGFSDESYAKYECPILEFDQKVQAEAFMCQFVNYYYVYFDEEEKALADVIIEEKTPLYQNIDNYLTKMYFIFEKKDYKSDILEEQKTEANSEETSVEVKRDVVEEPKIYDSAKKEAKNLVEGSDIRPDQVNVQSDKHNYALFVILAVVFVCGILAVIWKVKKK